MSALRTLLLNSIMAAPNIFMVNTHNFTQNLVEYFKYLRNGFALSGQKTGLFPEFYSGDRMINVMLEACSLEIAKELAQVHKKTGLRLVLVATEVVTGGTFNSIGNDVANSHYGDQAYWQERFDAFSILTEIAEAIWLVSEYQRSGYEEAFPNQRILTLPICFDPIESTTGDTFVAPKIYQALFLGTITNVRKEILTELEKHIEVCKPENFYSFNVRSCIKASRVCLHLNLQQDWPYTSVMRHHVLLTCGSYVISEKSYLPGELDDFVEVVPRETFVETVNARISDQDLVSKSKEIQRRYAANGDIG